MKQRSDKNIYRDTSDEIKNIIDKLSYELNCGCHQKLIEALGRKLCKLTGNDKLDVFEVSHMADVLEPDEVVDMITDEDYPTPEHIYTIIVAFLDYYDCNMPDGESDYWFDWIEKRTGICLYEPESVGLDEDADVFDVIDKILDDMETDVS